MIEEIRCKIRYILSKSHAVYRHFQFCTDFLFRRNRLLKKCSLGELHPDKNILVIRPYSEDGIQGLMSLFIQAMRWFEYANRKSLVPYVDFQNYKTQYHDGIHNVWDDYFVQNMTLSEVQRSKNVILSGSTWHETYHLFLFNVGVFTDHQLAEECRRLISQNIHLTDEVESIVNREAKRLNISECIGLYLRGTDYTALKHSGDFIQPDIESVIDKTRQFSQKYGCPPIFLVTEDAAYYKKLRSVFGDNLVLASFDNFIEDYTGKNYLSRSNVLNGDKKVRGMNYLVKIILLSRCRYLITSITSGSISSYCMNGGRYEDQYIFQLGQYP